MAAAHGLRAGPTKVLFVLDDFPGPYAGTELQFWLLAQGLDRNRFKPYVAVLRPPAQLAEHLGGIEHRVLGITRLSRPAAWLGAFRLACWARRNGYRVAQLFLNDVSILLPWPLRLFGIKVIISRRDVGFWYTPGNLRALRVNRRAVARVVANSEMVKEAVCREERYDPRLVRIIHNGIKYSPPASAATADLKWPRRPGARVIALVANLRRLKRIDDAIHVVHGLVDRGLDVELVVAGSYEGDDASAYKRELEALAGELRVAERVHFLGRVRGASAILDRCDVCVMCSESEGMSNALLEFLAAGRATVATRVGGAAEIIEDGRSGFLVAVGDVAAMTQQVANLLEDDELRRRVGAAAADRVATHFSVQRMVAAHEQLYTELA